MRVTMDGERLVPGIERVWPRVDVLVANPRFLARVSGRASVEEGLRVVQAAGPQRVAATLGAGGAIGLADGRLVRAPGFAVPVVDTNGAGDVFHGAVAFGELRGWPFEWVLAFANAVAALKCRALGGRRGIPGLSEVGEFLAPPGEAWRTTDREGGLYVSYDLRSADLREMARTAEAVGIDTLFVPDHLLFRKSPPANVMQVNMPEGRPAASGRHGQSSPPSPRRRAASISAARVRGAATS